MAAPVPFLSVVVPAYRCAPTLARALDALARSDLPRAEWELIVVDDGSPPGDETPAVAARSADRVRRVDGGPRGPAAARNLGASEARGEVLVFVDADVCVAPDALRRFATLFREHARLGAAFGAYDLTPEAPGLVSQYRNLVHHHGHATAAGPGVTFWAGLGAVRRAAFVAAGGFDAARYPRPQIEDVELGYRLAAAGWPIAVHPEIQGKHLKAWTLRAGLVTDVRDRGVPWMRLLLERGAGLGGGPLNVSGREKLLTVLAAGAGAALAAAVVCRCALPALLALAAYAALLAANAPVLRWLAERRGWGFALRAAPLRVAYYTLNALSAAWALATHIVRRPAARASTRTSP